MPKVTKNLVFIKKNCDDNPVSFKFDHESVEVKDRELAITLLKGGTCDGLYCIPRDMKKRRVVALSMEKTSLELWHHWLGHLNTKVKSVLAKDNVVSVIHLNQGYLVCKSFVCSKIHKSLPPSCATIYTKSVGSGVH